MQGEADDAAYLWDMLDAAKAALSFSEGINFEQYSHDRKAQLAVERAIEIVGEAAHHVSHVFQNSHPEIPWRQIVAQRNVLAHEYGEIQQERLWALLQNQLPRLILALESCMSSLKYPAI
jgi:uncharacterized protein with HEPN domain